MKKLYVGNVPQPLEIPSNIEENNIKNSTTENSNVITNAKKPQLFGESSEDDDGWRKNKTERLASNSFPEPYESFNKIEINKPEMSNARVNSFEGKEKKKSHLFDSSEDDDLLKPSKTKNSNVKWP